MSFIAFTYLVLGMTWIGLACAVVWVWTNGPRWPDDYSY